MEEEKNKNIKRGFNFGRLFSKTHRPIKKKWGKVKAQIESKKLYKKTKNAALELYPHFGSVYNLNWLKFI